jgi:hypothetical protein
LGEKVNLCVKKEEWGSVVKEAMVLKESQSQAVYEYVNFFALNPFV